MSVTVADITDAAKRIDGVAVRTPLLETPLLNAEIGGRLLVKPECLQKTGSFKLRGAFNRLVQLSDEDRKKGVVAFSSGNHAQGVAYAAQLLNIPATIVMPADAPAIKQQNTQAYGATVVTYDRSKQDREAIASSIAAKTGAIIVPSFNDPHIMAGQGTVGLEIAEDLQAEGCIPDQVLLCCGGGGLSSGAFLALRSVFSETDLYTVEPVGFDDTKRSLEAGERQFNAPGQTSLCDAILTDAPGPLPLDILLKVGAKGLTVSDHEALGGVKAAAHYFKVTAEPGGAVALAAALEGRVKLRDRTTVVIISGGNIDPEIVRRALD